MVVGIRLKNLKNVRFALSFMCSPVTNDLIVFISVVLLRPF